MYSFFVILYFLYFKTNKTLKNTINILEFHNFSLLVDKNSVFWKPDRTGRDSLKNSSPVRFKPQFWEKPVKPAKNW